MLAKPVVELGLTLQFLTGRVTVDSVADARIASFSVAVSRSRCLCECLYQSLARKPLRCRVRDIRKPKYAHVFRSCVLLQRFSPRWVAELVRRSLPTLAPPFSAGQRWSVALGGRGRSERFRICCAPFVITVDVCACSSGFCSDVTFLPYELIARSDVWIRHC